MMTTSSEPGKGRKTGSGRLTRTSLDLLLILVLGLDAGIFVGALVLGMFVVWNAWHG